MTRPYEDPLKIKMRERCEIAIDAAGYQLRDVAPIPYPPGSTLKGSVVGDLQAVDADNVVHVYYLRPAASKPLPQWLGNIALAVRRIERVKMYVIVETVSAVLERTCRASGAGLLCLDDNGRFEIVVDVGDAEDAAVREQVRAAVTALRRKLEIKLDLNVDQKKTSFASVVRATSGMSESKRDGYVKDVERQLERWRDWGQDMSARLDEAAASGSMDDVSALETLVDQGVLSKG